MAITNSEENKSRAEKRRLFREFKRREQYEKSGFLDFSQYRGVFLKRVSKYVPHIGKKQKGL